MLSFNRGEFESRKLEGEDSEGNRIELYVVVKKSFSKIVSIFSGHDERFPLLIEVKHRDYTKWFSRRHFAYATTELEAWQRAEQIFNAHSQEVFDDENLSFPEVFFVRASPSIGQDRGQTNEQ